MSKYSIQKYNPKYYDRWNRFVDQSLNGTIFHRLDFLGYHDNKYSFEECLIFLKGEAIVAILPLHVENGIAKSPFAASFGGIIVSKNISLQVSETLVQLFVKYLIENEIKSCSIVLPPAHYNVQLNNYLSFSLPRNGFKLYWNEIFNVVRLSRDYKDMWEQKYLSRNRNIIRKAQIDFDIYPNCSLDEFYPILVEDKLRHNSKPTHSHAELERLQAMFPDRIWFDLAKNDDNEGVAICYFQVTSKVLMTFYMCQTSGALGKHGKNVLIDYGIQRAIQNQIEYFDFGGSTVGYEIVNMGVSKFKESFGAYASLRQKFIWNQEEIKESFKVN